MQGMSPTVIVMMKGELNPVFPRSQSLEEGVAAHHERETRRGV